MTIFKTIEEILKDESECPLNISVIPNYMGINLSSVDGLSWSRLDDGQLVGLTIHFRPELPATE